MDPIARARELAEEFEEFKAHRLEVGAEEYGEFAFLNLERSELFRMFYEEIADQANYLTFTYVKMRMMEEELASRIDQSIQSTNESAEHWLPSGTGSFVRNTDIHRLLQDGAGVQDPGQRSG